MAARARAWCCGGTELSVLAMVLRVKINHFCCPTCCLYHHGWFVHLYVRPGRASVASGTARAIPDLYSTICECRIGLWGSPVWCRSHRIYNYIRNLLDSQLYLVSALLSICIPLYRRTDARTVTFLHKQVQNSLKMYNILLQVSYNIYIYIYILTTGLLIGQRIVPNLHCSFFSFLNHIFQ